MKFFKWLFGSGSQSAQQASAPPAPSTPSDESRWAPKESYTLKSNQKNTALDEQLILAVEQLNLDEIKSLVVAGASVNATKKQEAVGGSSKGDFCVSSKGDRF